MKKYIVFSIFTYYPAGGLRDISKSFDVLDDAIKHLNEIDGDRRYIVDRDIWEKVFDTD